VVLYCCHWWRCGFQHCRSSYFLVSPTLDYSLRRGVVVFKTCVAAFQSRLSNLTFGAFVLIGLRFEQSGAIPVKWPALMKCKNQVGKPRPGSSMLLSSDREGYNGRRLIVFRLRCGGIFSTSKDSTTDVLYAYATYIRFNSVKPSGKKQISTLKAHDSLLNPVHNGKKRNCALARSLERPSRAMLA
jgi:hypothetical protein